MRRQDQPAGHTEGNAGPNSAATALSEWRVPTDSAGEYGSTRRCRRTSAVGQAIPLLGAADQLTPTLGRMLDLGLDPNLWPWIWLALGVGFTVIEFRLLGGRMRLLPFAITADLAALLAFGDVGIAWQCSVFAGGGLVLLAVTMRYQALVREGNRLPPGAGAVRLVGMEGVVTRALDSAAPDRPVQALVLGENWAVIEPADDLAVGATIVVTEVEGTRVRIRPVAHPSVPTWPMPTLPAPAPPVEGNP